jgi:hypothetical protein
MIMGQDIGTSKILVETWKSFLTEEEYTDEELANNPLWNDLPRGDIDGFFWNTRDGSLKSYTDQIYNLADEIDFTIEDDVGFKQLRDVAMQSKSIGDAFRALSPENEVPPDVSLTDPGSPRAFQRQVARTEKESENLIDNLIDDIIQSLGGSHSPDEILNKIQTRAGERKNDKEI